MNVSLSVEATVLVSVTLDVINRFGDGMVVV